MPPIKGKSLITGKGGAQRKGASVPCSECPSGQVCPAPRLQGTAREAVEKRRVTNAFRRGQILFYEGNAPLGVFFIVSGQVKLYKTGAAGRSTLMRIAGPGEILGHRAVFANENYGATAEVVEDGEICFLDRAAAAPLLVQDPELAAALLRNLALEANEAESRLRDATQLPVKERMAALLVRLAQDHGEGPPHARRIALHLTRQDLADLVGTTQETVVRLLSQFKRSGWIQLKAKDIVVVRGDLMARAAGLPPVPVPGRFGAA